MQQSKFNQNMVAYFDVRKTKRMGKEGNLVSARIWKTKETLNAKKTKSKLGSPSHQRSFRIKSSQSLPSLSALNMTNHRKRIAVKEKNTKDVLVGPNYSSYIGKQCTDKKINTYTQSDSDITSHTTKNRLSKSVPITAVINEIYTDFRPRSCATNNKYFLCEGQNTTLNGLTIQKQTREIQVPDRNTLLSDSIESCSEYVSDEDSYPEDLSVLYAQVRKRDEETQMKINKTIERGLDSITQLDKTLGRNSYNTLRLSTMEPEWWLENDANENNQNTSHFRNSVYNYRRENQTLVHQYKADSIANNVTSPNKISVLHNTFKFDNPHFDMTSQNNLQQPYHIYRTKINSMSVPHAAADESFTLTNNFTNQPKHQTKFGLRFIMNTVLRTFGLARNGEEVY